MAAPPVLRFPDGLDQRYGPHPGETMILDRFKVTDKVAIVTGRRPRASAAASPRRWPRRAPTSCARPARSTSSRTTAEAIRATGRRALAVPTDVTDAAQLERLVAATVAEFGRIDILVNNAGGWPPQPLLRTSERAFERCVPLQRHLGRS